MSPIFVGVFFSLLGVCCNMLHGQGRVGVVDVAATVFWSAEFYFRRFACRVVAKDATEANGQTRRERTRLAYRAALRSPLLGPLYVESRQSVSVMGSSAFSIMYRKFIGFSVCVGLCTYSNIWYVEFVRETFA